MVLSCLSSSDSSDLSSEESSTLSGGVYTHSSSVFGADCADFCGDFCLFWSLPSVLRLFPRFRGLRSSLSLTAFCGAVYEYRAGGLCVLALPRCDCAALAFMDTVVAMGCVAAESATADASVADARSSKSAFFDAVSDSCARSTHSFAAAAVFSLRAASIARSALRIAARGIGFL